MSRALQTIHHYLLASATLSFIGGILVFQLLPLSLITASILSTGCALFTLFFLRFGPHQIGTFSLLFFVASLGMVRMAHHEFRLYHETTLYHHIPEETDLVLSGTLHGMPVSKDNQTSFLFKSSMMRKKEDKHFSPVRGKILVKVKGTLPPNYLVGDELLLRVKLSRPYRFGNPGGFDYPAFLAARDITMVGRVSSPAHIHGVDYEKTFFRTLSYIPERIRSEVRGFLDAKFAGETAAIYKALLIGDRSGISKQQFEYFKATGVVHIFAISGIHLSLVATTLFLFFYWLLKRSPYLLQKLSCKKPALLATVPFLTAYALLAGAQTPVMRSLLMVLTFIFAYAVQRNQSPFTTLSFAALLILMFNPLSLFTVSFQLSFLAVASLILILPKLQELVTQNDTQNKEEVPLYHKIGTWSLAGLLVSIAATIGTAPLLLYYFNRISTVGPLVNLLLEPLLCLFSLPIGLIAIPCIYLAPTLAELLFSLGAGGIHLALLLSKFFAGFSFATLWLATPAIPVILFYYATLLLLRSRPSLPQGSTFLLACALFFYPPQAFLHRLNKDSELVFLDVGQGSATVILLPHGKTALVDGGGATSVHFNIGESVIGPYLWSRGITQLDAVLISHPDADHYNGLPHILKRFSPKTLYINGDTGRDDGYHELLSLAQSKGISVHTVDKEEVLLQSGAGQLSVIHNPYQQQVTATSNDRSIVARFSHGSSDVILPGDISKSVEQELVHRGNLLKARILLAPHHGSVTSSSVPFLQQVAPEYIIASAGRFKPQHFPSTALRNDSRRLNIPLLNTAKHGAIRVRLSQEKMEVDTFYPL